LHHSLDEPGLAQKIDPQGILALTDGFAAQCSDALKLGASIELPGQFTNAVLIGVGGSAVAGDYLRVVFDRFGKLPFSVCRGYEAPAWINQNTLCIVSSYSGNTEETLSAYEYASAAQSTILAITSGGELASQARKNGDVIIKIPGGQPPRTALGYSFLTLLVGLQEAKLLEGVDTSGVAAFLAFQAPKWSINVPFDQNPAKQIADFLFQTTCVVYGLGDWQGAVANRWKAQINENAKAMAFANTFPELNHNEILGWSSTNETWSCLILEDGEESEQMRKRASFTLSSLPSHVRNSRVKAPGKTVLEKMLGLTLLGDYASVYLAYMRNVDPGDISLLEKLKTELRS